jgi:multidrug resistance efflux pump
MSTFGELVPDASNPMDGAPQLAPENSPKPPKPGRKLVGIVGLASLAIFIAIAVVIAGHRARSVRHVQPAISSTAAVHSLRLKGTTQAIQSRAILAPALSGQQLGSLTIVKLAPGGSHVKRGDLLVEFDRQAQLRDYLDKQAEYNKFVSQVAEEQAKEGINRAKDETELHQAESDLKTAQLDMHKVELMSRIDEEKARQTLEQSKATLAQLKETFELKRNAARAAINILEIQRDRALKIMQNAQGNAELMQIKSPLDGVIVLNTIWRNGRMGEVQEGDQVRPGVSFMQVVDPSAMQVQVPVNQEDIFALKEGQAATVRLDAYPDLVLPGKLEWIAPVSRRGDFSDKVRTFAATFSIQGSDPRMMPDLSAAVDVEIGAARTVASKARR